MTKTIDELLNNVLSKLDRVTGGPDKYTASCPAHSDQNPSLSITVKPDGKLLLCCHTGCTTGEVCDALGIGVADLFPKSTAKKTAKPKVRGRIVGTYDYVDESGAILFQVVRYDPKDFRQRQPSGLGGWTWGTKGVRRVLYHLPELLAADPSAWVFIPEGEKDVHNLADAGLVATTNPGGAGKWKHLSDDEALCGLKVCILPDEGEKGAKHALDVASRLHGCAADVRIVRLDGLPPKGDVSDWLQSHDASELIELADAASSFAPATSAIVDPDSSAWEPPLSFDTFQLPSFPLNAFPDRLCAISEFCARATESYQVPADVTPLLVLAVGATALAKRIEIRIQPDWIEPANIFVAVAMESGERKSAIFREVFAPISRFERDEVERCEPIVEQAAMERAIVEHALKKAKKDAGESKNAVDRIAAKGRAEQLTRELRESPVLYAPRYTADDATVEAVTRLLFEQGGRIAILSPEGDAFDLMAGRYSSKGVPNIGTYLKGHAGDTIRVDRVNKDRPPEHIPSPALTIGLAIQPDVLRGLAENKGFRGRGLLARFLFSLPSSRVGRRELHPRSIPADVSKRYAALVHAVMRFGHPSGEVDTSLQTVAVGQAAAARLDQFRGDVEVAMKDGGHLATIRDWALKLPGAVCRVAGILHGFIHAPTGDPDAHPINEETMTGAISVGKYFIEHALAAFNLMSDDPAVAGARRLIKWIREEQLTDFSRRDAYNRIRTAGAKVWVVDAPLELLVEHTYVRERATDRDGPGRKPSATYIVNPHLLEQNPHNTHNQSEHGNSAHSADSALRGSKSPQVESAHVEQLRHSDSEAVSSANGDHDASSGSHDNDDASDENERRAIQEIEAEEEDYALAVNTGDDSPSKRTELNNDPT